MRFDLKYSFFAFLVVTQLFVVLGGWRLVSGMVAGTDRLERGMAAFKDPFEAELAAAIVACDLAKVQALLPRATYQNLNDLRGNTTLFVFALEQGNGPASPERLELVKALLKAGGFVGYPKGRALAAVAAQGFAMNKLLLEAGAYVNERESAGEYPWRQWVRRDAEGREQVEMLKLYIAHGATLNLRYAGPSAVAEAVRQDSWETALVLLEAGAQWTEGDLAGKAREALAKYGEGEAPEALRKVLSRLS